MQGIFQSKWSSFWHWLQRLINCTFCHTHPPSSRSPAFPPWRPPAAHTRRSGRQPPSRCSPRSLCRSRSRCWCRPWRFGWESTLTHILQKKGENKSIQCDVVSVWNCIFWLVVIIKRSGVMSDFSILQPFTWQLTFCSKRGEDRWEEQAGEPS